MADLTEYKPRQATETWQEYLGRQGPELMNGVALALAGLRAPPAIMRGPAQGLRMEDFAKARAVDARAEQIARDGIRLGQPRYDPGVTGGASYMDAPYAAEKLGETARAYTPQPFRTPQLPTDPYDAAVAMQALMRAANK